MLSILAYIGVLAFEGHELAHWPSATENIYDFLCVIGTMIIMDLSLLGYMLQKHGTQHDLINVAVAIACAYIVFDMIHSPPIVKPAEATEFHPWRDVITTLLFLIVANLMFHIHGLSSKPMSPPAGSAKAT